MSLSSPQSAPRPQVRPVSGRPVPRRPARLRWGWIEIVMVSLVLFPMLTFLPFLRPIRLLLRVGNYGISLVAWMGVLTSGRNRRMPAFPAQSWMTFCVGWLGLQVFNPMGDFPLAVPAHFLLNLAIISPIFWAPQLADSYERVDRMMRILFLCSLASVLVGFLQYRYPGQVVNDDYIPGRFDPPYIQILEMTRDTGYWRDLMIEKPNGQEVFRPFGLTDSPGGASMAASNCCLIGMAWIVSLRSFWKRGLLAVAVLMSMTMLYYCQVRAIYLVTLGGLGLLGFSLFVRRDFRALSVLSILGLVVFTLALGWAIRSGGDAVLKRFQALTENSAVETYSQSRGGFLAHTFQTLIWEYPLGAGLGHWGMINVYFGTTHDGSYYSEIQASAWVFDGGIPLLVAYSAGALLALWQVFRIGVKTSNPSFGKMACTVVGICAGILVAGFSGMPFISPMGLQFWLMVGMVIGTAAHTAPRARVRGRA